MLARAPPGKDQCVSLRRMSRIRFTLSLTSSVSCLSILRGLSWSSSRLAMNDVSVCQTLTLLFNVLQGLDHVEDDSALVCCLLFGDWSEDWHRLFMMLCHPLQFRLTDWSSVRT